MTYYVKKEEMDRFIAYMFAHNLTPISLVGPYMKERYRRQEGRKPRMLTVNEMMEHLKVSRSTIYRYMKEGMPYETDPERGRMFDKGLCDAYLRQRKAVISKQRRVARG